MENQSKHSEDLKEKISQILQKRPPQGRFRDQLFWLVDLIYACKASNNRVLIEEAKLMEKALKHLGEFLETGNQLALDEATKRVEQFARIVKASVSGVAINFNIFLSYSTKDSEYFDIPKIAKMLESYKEISKVYYWEKDSGQNIIEYMEENLEKSKVFIYFCSQNSKVSKSVKLERSAAIQLQQEGRIRILPVFLDPADIPLLIKPFLGVEFNKENIEEFIQNLYKEIFRE
jgi:hypothetical protein